MGSTFFRYPQALSSTLALLGMLQPWAFGSLNHVDPLDSVSNYYLENALDYIRMMMMYPIDIQ